MAGCDVNLTCPSCEQNIHVDLRRVHAEIHPDWPRLNRLIYRCPACNRPQRHDLQPHQWEFLTRSVGAELHRVTLPRGLVSRFAPGQTPLSDDDVIAFGLAMEALPSAEADA